MAAIRPSRAMTKSVPVIRKDAAATAGLLSGVWGRLAAYGTAPESSQHSPPRLHTKSLASISNASAWRVNWHY